MKKIISLLIVVAMLAGMVPAVFADVGVAEDNVFVFDATKDLEAFDKGAKADGDTLTVHDYFTVIFSAKTKVDGSNKEFADGYTASQRLNFGGKTDPKKGMINSVKFTTAAAATVKLWWVAGGADRYMAIYDADNNVILSSEEGGETNSLHISEFTLDAAGTYYIGVPNGNNYLFKAEVTEASDEEPSEDTNSGTIEAVKGEVYDSETWTAPATGLLNITISSAEGAGYLVYINDEEQMLSYDMTYSTVLSYEVAEGDQVRLSLRGWNPDSWAYCDATIHYSFAFVEGGSVKEAYIISEQNITQAGTHTVTMEQNAEVTIVPIGPSETGYYTVSVPEGTLIANCGGGSWYIHAWDTVEHSTSIEWLCEEAGYWTDAEVDTGNVGADGNPIYETVHMFIQGQTLMLGIVSDSETVEVTVTKTADYVNEEIALQEYVNKAPLSQFTVPEGAVIGDYVNVYGDTHTAVLGSDGYYHLNSSNGPILLVDLDYIFRLSEALEGGRGVMYAYVTDENGNVMEKWDIGAAIKAYEAVSDENRYYPLTEDLIFFYDTYAAGNGVYAFALDEGYNADCAWMFACLTMTMPGGETPDAELGTEENPIIIDSLPYEIEVSYKKDAQAFAGIFYLYTAEKNGTIFISNPEDFTGILMIVNANGDPINLNENSYDIQAGETVLLNHWAVMAGDYNLVLDFAEATDTPDEPEGNDHILNPSEDLDIVEKGSMAEGDTILVDDYFTIICNEKTSVNDNDKTFEDGFVGTRRLNFGGKTQGDMFNSIMFTTSAAATVKIWWVCGGDGRTMAIYDAEGNVILSDGAESVKNELYITEFALDAAGTYYIGVPGGSNYVFQVAVSEEEASDPEIPDGPEVPDEGEWSGVDVPVTTDAPITIVFTPDTNGTLVVTIDTENWALYIEEEFGSSAYWSDINTSPVSEKLTAGVTYTITLYAYDGMWDHIDGTLTYNIVFNAATEQPDLPVDGTLVDGDNHMELPADDEDGLVRYEYIATQTGTLHVVVTYVGWDEYGTGIYEDDTSYIKDDFNGMTALSVNGVVLDGYYYGSIYVVEGETYIFEWADTVTWNDINGWEATLNLSYTDELIPVVGTEDMPVELNSYYTELPLNSIAIAPGTTAYYVLLGFNGMTFTITGENAYAIVTTSEWDLDLDKQIVTEIRYDAVNGVVEIPITGWGAYTVQIGNAGDTETSFVLDAYYPVGSMENPDTNMNIGNNKVDIAENSMYYYQWTAPCNGTLTITLSGKNWDYVVHNITAGIYNEWNCYYGDPQVPSTSVAVSKGDVIEIQIATLEMDEFESVTQPAAIIYFTAEFAYDHELGEGVHHDATCGQDAYTEYTCAICGEKHVEVEEGTALEHNFVDGKCEHCGAYDYILGDVNGDGEVDIFDANLVAAYFNEIIDLSADQLTAADVNGDGEVDIFDANLIAAYFNEVIDVFPKAG